MALSDLYGTDNIKVINFLMYISDSEYTDTMGTSFESITSSSALDSFLSTNGFVKVGRLDASIGFSTENGDTVDDNEENQLIINKTGSITAEHIAVTPEIKKTLRSIDGQVVNVVLVPPTGDTKTAFLFNNLRYSYEENDSSDDVPRIPINFSREITKVSDFRKIAEITS